MSVSANAKMAGAIPPRESSKPELSGEVKAAIAQERQDLARWRNLHEVQRQHLMRRTGLIWDVDRNAEVEEIAQRMQARPGLTVARLKKTFHGCKYLIERWNYLGRRMISPKFTGEFDDSDRAKALSLLGIPRDEHDLDCYSIDTPTVLRSSPTWRKEATLEISRLIGVEFADLNDLLDELRVEDEERRGQAELGEFHGTDRLLNRYERAIQASERRIRSLEKSGARAEKAAGEQPQPPPAPESGVPPNDEPAESTSDPLADQNE